MSNNPYKPLPQDVVDRYKLPTKDVKKGSLMKINYQKGDLFKHLPAKNWIIPHIVNTRGVMGAGFVLPLKKSFPQAEEIYLQVAKMPCGLRLGHNSYAMDIKDNKINGVIVNMVAQHGVISSSNPKPIRYAALTECMQRLVKFATYELDHVAGGWEIVAPKFGSGLAGGNWDYIEELINEIWIGNNIPVTVYEL